MEVHHKHGPLRNWREFAKEIGVIVIGVLIALGGEQAVEAIHHRQEVHDARDALEEELAWDLGAFKDYVGTGPCMARRLDELDRWEKAWEDGRRLPLLRSVAIPTGRPFRTAVWRVTASDAVARMPLRERIGYATIYDEVDNQDRLHSEAANVWRDIAQYGGARHLSEDQLRQISNDIAKARGLLGIMQSNYAKQMVADAARLQVSASAPPKNAEEQEALAVVCEPLLAS